MPVKKSNNENDLKESASSNLDTTAILEMLNKLQNSVSILENKLLEEKEKSKELDQKLEEKTQELKRITESKAKNNEESSTEKLINYLANKKSEKEVTIVHNRELMEGLSTHIALTGLTIDFRRLGEERVLSWQQFEECVSKYRSWFEKEIILLSSDFKELGETYKIPCVKRKEGVVIVSSDLKRIGNMTPRELEDYYNSLTAEDKNFLCSYWLGKCYSKEKDFYDRYKIELLNRLNGEGVFDNILAMMNNDFRNVEKIN